MIKSIQYILFLIYSLVIISCNKVEINEPDSGKYYVVSGTVWDYINYYSPKQKVGVPVVIGKDTSVSNSEGVYYFGFIPKGKHIINASFPNYKFYADTINVLSDTTIDIYLVGFKEDYFPIKVNTQKSFKYHFDGCGGLFCVSDSGRATWNIYSLTQQGDKFIYNAEETLIYVRTQKGEIFPPDTIITKFKFIEDESHIITIQSTLWDGIYFDRYLDPGNADVIQYEFDRSPGRFTIYLKRNVGLYRLQEVDNFYMRYTIYELIE